MSNLRDAALDYANHGWKVFPCKPRGKEPIVLGGYKAASADPELIKSWWEAWPDANIGLAMADNGLFAIDVDPRNGGYLTLPKLLPIIPETLHQITGGGGEHFILRLPLGEKLAGSLGDGIDVKANGYILAAPSVHPSGGIYQWDPLAPDVVASPGSELINRLKRTKAKTQPAALTVTDRQWAEMRDALACIPADRREQWLLAGMALHSTGHPDARELWDSWSETTAEGNFNPAGQDTAWASFKPDGGTDYRAILAEAARHGWVNPRKSEPLSTAEATALFTSEPLPTGEVVDPLTGRPARGPKLPVFQIEHYNDIELDGGGGYAVKGLIPKPGLTALYGPPGAGKTWLALEAALAVSRGRRLFDRYRTRQARTAYVAAEAPGSIKSRVGALRQYGNEPANDEFLVVHGGLDFTNRTGTEFLARLLNEHGAQFVVVDTAAAVMRGSDENSAEGIGLLLRGCAQIVELCGAAVLLVHHQGKSAEKGMRGHSSLLGAVDACMLQTRDKDTGVFTVELEKSRDGSVGDKFELTLDRFDAGTDGDGDPRSSCRMRWHDPDTSAAVHGAIQGADKKAPGAPRSADAKAVLRAIVRSGKTSGPLSQPGMPIKELADLSAGFLYEDDKGKALTRCMKALAELDAEGWVLRVGDDVIVNREEE